MRRYVKQSKLKSKRSKSLKPIQDIPLTKASARSCSPSKTQRLLSHNNRCFPLTCLDFATFFRVLLPLQCPALRLSNNFPMWSHIISLLLLLLHHLLLLHSAWQEEVACTVSIAVYYEFTSIRADGDHDEIIDLIIAVHLIARRVPNPQVCDVLMRPLCRPRRRPPPCPVSSPAHPG